jgi:hypothetical protein
VATRGRLPPFIPIHSTIVVEGKANEAFGPTVSQWREEASTGKQERIAYISKTLQLDNKSIDTIRYQLLHRAASAIIEARRFGGRIALLLVHAFADSPESYADFTSFLSLYGVSAQKNSILGPANLVATELHFCWLQDKAV